jgi:Bacteriophage probable baseplate hub protein
MPEDSSNMLKVARPTILVDGEENQSLALGLLSLLVAETTSGLYRCEAMFGNWGTSGEQTDFLYFDRTTLDFGKQFQIKLDSELIFDGKITGMEAHFPEATPPELVVLAEDRFQDLRMTRRTRTFTDMSDSAVINQIANDHGLSPQVSVSGPTYKMLAQVNQSDLAFLRERARAIDAELWMDGNNLNAKSHSARNGTTLQLDFRANLRAFSVLADLAHQRTSLTVNGWDVASKESISFEATESAIREELNGDTSGASILSSAFGPRKEALVHTVPLSSQEAQTEAETYFKMSARRFVVGRGVAETSSELRVGSYVNLKGLGPLFNGKYYLTEVHHLFDNSLGLRSEFTAERPGLGQAA